MGGGMPRPRKDSEPSATISTAITITEYDSTAGNVLGSSSLKMIRPDPQPIALATVTYSRLDCAIALALVRRVKPGMVNTARPAVMLVCDGSYTEDSASS